MKTHSLFLALSLLIPAGAAQAQAQAQSPVQGQALGQAQAQAQVRVLRAAAAPNGDNLVVIAVNDVRVPATLPGQCMARGVVTQVVTGSQFHAGQSLAIKVACGHRTPIVDNRPLTRDSDSASIDAMVMSRAKKAVVRLDDSGAVIWRPATGLPETQNGQYRDAYGYVVLDGVKLPLRSQAS
jgi:hypothetical protein